MGQAELESRLRPRTTRGTPLSTTECPSERVVVPDPVQNDIPARGRGANLKLGAAVVDYTIRHRPKARQHRFPLTAGWIQWTAEKLGHSVGRDKAYDIQHALLGAGAIVPAGYYQRRRDRRRVLLYRPGDGGLLAAARSPASVPGREKRKRRCSWKFAPWAGAFVDLRPDLWTPKPQPP